MCAGGFVSAELIVHLQDSDKKVRTSPKHEQQRQPRRTLETDATTHGRRQSSPALLFQREKNRHLFQPRRPRGCRPPAEFVTRTAGVEHRKGVKRLNNWGLF